MQRAGKSETVIEELPEKLRVLYFWSFIDVNRLAPCSYRFAPTGFSSEPEEYADMSINIPR